MQGGVVRWDTQRVHCTACCKPRRMDQRTTGPFNVVEYKKWSKKNIYHLSLLMTQGIRKEEIRSGKTRKALLKRFVTNPTTLYLFLINKKSWERCLLFVSLFSPVPWVPLGCAIPPSHHSWPPLPPSHPLSLARGFKQLLPTRPVCFYYSGNHPSKFAILLASQKVPIVEKISYSQTLPDGLVLVSHSRGPKCYQRCSISGRLREAGPKWWPGRG